MQEVVHKGVTSRLVWLHLCRDSQVHACVWPEGRLETHFHLHLIKYPPELREVMQAQRAAGAELPLSWPHPSPSGLPASPAQASIHSRRRWVPVFTCTSLPLWEALDSALEPPDDAGTCILSRPLSANPSCILLIQLNAFSASTMC